MHQKDKPKDGIGAAKKEDDLILNIEAIRDYAGTVFASIANDWVETAQRRAFIEMLEEIGEHEETS